ncbi:MAG: hypothetical protein FWC41_09880 [Firmicutes bacterium]|nr:hypothetical protein [Bacillota bacterium]
MLNKKAKTASAININATTVSTNLIQKLSIFVFAIIIGFASATNLSADANKEWTVTRSKSIWAQAKDLITGQNGYAKVVQNGSKRTLDCSGSGPHECKLIDINPTGGVLSDNKFNELLSEMDDYVTEQFYKYSTSEDTSSLKGRHTDNLFVEVDDNLYPIYRTVIWNIVLLQEIEEEDLREYSWETTTWITVGKPIK